MRAQAIILDLIHYAARGQHRHKARYAKLARFFGDPVKPILFNERLTYPKVRAEFTITQLGIDCEIKVAFAQMGYRRKIFTGNIVKQFYRRTLFQAHDTCEVMRAVASDVQGRAHGQRLFHKQPGCRFWGPGGCCGHISRLPTNRAAVISQLNPRELRR